MTQDPKASPQAEETVSPKIRRALVVLAGLLVLCAIAAGVLLWSQGSGDSDSGSNFSKSLQKLEGGSMSLEFPVSRTLPAGAGLSDWLESVEGKERIRGVAVDAVAIYSVDARSDWDLGEIEGRLRVSAPMPELKGIRVSDENIRIDVQGAPLAAEDEKIARDLLLEELPSLLRQDEDAQRTRRLEAMRAKIADFVAQSTKKPVGEIDIRFPGEETAGEESP